MKVLALIFCVFLFAFAPQAADWRHKKLKAYSLYDRSEDPKNLKEYEMLVNKGISATVKFFGSKFKTSFGVYVHPNRSSLDSTWQTDWKMPEFKSECWMVASGVASRLDMISPKMWDKESCEHKYSDKVKTQQLITHELIHVFHGQYNPSPDFSEVQGIDWLVEGLAVYASGQCDSLRLAEVKQDIKENKIPDKLENFWTGKHKYGLAGSMMMYIDKKFGRKKVIELLPLVSKEQVMEKLGISEQQLIEEWLNSLK